MRQNKNIRSFHREARVVYRCFRRSMGIDKAQEECLILFKIVFPDYYNAKERSTDATYQISDEKYQLLKALVEKWNPQPGRLQVLCEFTLAKLKCPMWRKDFIAFCEDIMVVVMRIRKLTERECYRLMDVPEDKIDILLGTSISKSSHYKLAGNSIVVSPMFHIFKNLLVEDRSCGGTGEVIQTRLF